MKLRLRLGFVLLGLLLGICHSSAQTNTYTLGSIPPHSIRHGETLVFRVESPTSMPTANLDVLVSSALPNGSLNHYAVSTGSLPTREISYTPATNDFRALSLNVRAEDGTNLLQQTATITPFPLLPPEHSIFGIRTQSLPDPASKDYIQIDVITNTPPKDWNWVNRATRELEISGKTLVLEPGHPCGLYETLHSVADLERLNLEAETIIVRAPLHVPQCAVSIACRELRFEDLNGQDPASIITTPQDPPLSRPAGVSGAQGADGLPAGTITAHYLNLVTPTNSVVRFDLTGGQAQSGGLGRDGVDGQDLPDLGGQVMPTTTNLIMPTGTVYYERYDFCSHDTVHQFICGDAMGGQFHTSGGAEGVWPGDGEHAISGGLPGTGGAGGDLIAPTVLEGYLVEQTGGASGAKAPDTSGGQAGTPVNAIRFQFKTYFNYGANTPDPEWGACSTHQSVYGNDAHAPTATAASGPAGTVQVTPVQATRAGAMGASLQYVRDTYINGQLDTVDALLQEHLSDLATVQADPLQWPTLSAAEQYDLLSFEADMEAMQHRLDAGLDYFGNPPGWVPMLSFEANKAIYEGEIERAIRSMYLAYWLGHVAGQHQSTMDALTSARTLLQEDTTAARDEYDSILTGLPALSLTASNLTVRVQEVEEEARQLEKELLTRAQHIVEERYKKSRWEKALGFVTGAVQLFFSTTTAIETTSQGLRDLGNIDINNPFGALGDLNDIASAFTDSEYERFSTEWKDQAYDFDLLVYTGAFDYAVTLHDQYSDIRSAVEEMHNARKDSEAPRSEVEAELMRLKATDPDFIAIVDLCLDVIAEKEAFGLQVQLVTDRIADLTTRITQNLLGIDAMNQDLGAGIALIDSRLLLHLSLMSHRSRSRLLRYHYNLAKAYEYRMLQAYPGTLNLTPLFNRFVELAETGSSGILTESEFLSLKSIYEEELATIAETIFTEYNNNRPELSVPVRFNIPSYLLDELNEGKRVVLNLKDIGLFGEDVENIRIVSLGVYSVDAHLDGTANFFAYSDIIMEHSGISRLEKGAETYLFDHFNNRSSSAIEWGARYDALDETISPIVPSAASDSLLRSLLSSKGISTTDSNVMLYSRPAGWADLEIRKQDNIDGATKLVLDSLRLEVQYDFIRKRTDQGGFRIVPSSDDLAPLIELSSVDISQRQEGRGTFSRTFNDGTSVTLTAPEEYGAYSFIAWTDRYGTPLSPTQGNPPVGLTLSVGDYQVVRAHYDNPDLQDSDNDGLPDWWEKLYFNDLDEDGDTDTDQDGLTNMEEFEDGTHPGIKDSDGDAVGDGSERGAGTNPVDADSVLEASSMTLEGTMITITWETVLNRSYQLQTTSSSISDHAWSNQGPPFTGTGEPVTIQIPRGDGFQATRLIVLP